MDRRRYCRPPCAGTKWCTRSLTFVKERRIAKLMLEIKDRRRDNKRSIVEIDTLNTADLGLPAKAWICIIKVQWTSPYRDGRPCQYISVLFTSIMWVNLGLSGLKCFSSSANAVMLTTLYVLHIVVLLSAGTLDKRCRVRQWNRRLTCRFMR